MRNLMLVMLSSFLLANCDAQTKKDQSKGHAENITESIEPKINYKVTKEYDEYGNLIKLDSTYSYYYSNIDKNALMSDSVFSQFNEHFNLNSPFDNSFFDDFLRQERYLQDDFFKQDFFRGNFDRNQELMHKMMQRMDSMKNKFFIDRFPLNEENKDINDE